ncbi:unnamed protein product [Didymodactylos carnosus]|uniref:Uncharacterized protein n=1 Tax=Didymodactylos carnosus TaxID=1234261 RepID=A0A815I9P0_9BILA|nr:unnamed protein product [Didymodactylos carnosus]CAF1362134.1 unnamed protein product [Didymodactylos carnosus]CAF3928821.1 unnamed protein product [Didymodactylos carnosus]CAF4241409.1 unnamed protein product [Didymodactylos carnosus]
MPSDNPNTILQLNKSKTQHVQPSAPMISHSHISSSTLPQQPASPTIKTLSRARTISSTDSGETDSVTDLHKPLKLTNSAIIKPDNRRNSDLNKTHLHGKYSLQLSDERRNSTPALHLSTLSSLHFSTLFKKKHKQQK